MFYLYQRKANFKKITYHFIKKPVGNVIKKPITYRMFTEYNVSMILITKKCVQFFIVPMSYYADSIAR